MLKKKEQEFSNFIIFDKFFIKFVPEFIFLLISLFSWRENAKHFDNEIQGPVFSFYISLYLPVFKHPLIADVEGWTQKYNFQKTLKIIK